MKTIVLTDAELQQLIRAIGIDRLMDELIEQLFQAFAAFDATRTEIPARTGFYYRQPAQGLIEWMPLLARDGRMLMKIVGYHPDSPQRYQLPTILSTFMAYDTGTGHLASLIDGTLLTAMRTGAASAVASRLLALPGSGRVGLIGCGAQAVTQLHALSRVFTIQEVLFFDLNPAVMRSFPERIAGVVACSANLQPMSTEEILAQADIVSVATSVEVGRGPVVPHVETRPWLHINAVGSDVPGKNELPTSLLRQSYVCPDNLAQARLEGECQQLDEPEIGATLLEIARLPDKFCGLQQQRTVFDSTGWALEDYITMELVLQYASALGIGSEISIESLPADPQNPYEFLSGAISAVNLTAS